jgi:hypothetical protein
MKDRFISHLPEDAPHSEKAGWTMVAGMIC